MESSKKSTPRNQVPPANGATFAEYRRTLEALEQYVTRLKQMAERYPIFLTVAGVGYRFDSPVEVDEFVLVLRAEVERYGAARAVG